MREPTSVAALEELGRVQLSANFYMRDFLYSEIANFHGLSNIPADPAVAIEAGRGLCQALLEPLQATFGRIAIRSAYRSPSVNQYGNEHGYSCASNAANFGRHIWDRRDAEGCLGAAFGSDTRSAICAGRRLTNACAITPPIHAADTHYSHSVVSCS